MDAETGGQSGLKDRKRAIEDQARQRGFSRLYLYTTDAVGFYERLSWSVLDRTNWKGSDTALMVRDLQMPRGDEE